LGTGEFGVDESLFFHIPQDWGTGVRRRTLVVMRSLDFQHTYRLDSQQTGVGIPVSIAAPP
jgi:hypothetical protein